MEKFLIIKDESTTNKRFRTIRRKIEFTIKPIPEVEENPVGWVTEAIHGIIEKALEGLHADDKVGVTFCNKTFKERTPGWMSFRRVADVKIDDIMNIIIFQSNSSDLSTDTFCLETTSVQLART